MKQIKINKNLKNEADKMRSASLKSYLDALILHEYYKRGERTETHEVQKISRYPDMTPNRISVYLTDTAYEKAEEMARQDLRAVGSFVNWLIACEINRNRQKERS